MTDSPQSTSTTTSDAPSAAGERADILALLGEKRYFLRYTVSGLTDEQAAARPTVSELCVGGLIKHVAATESQWADFIVHGTAAMQVDGEGDEAQYASGFRMTEGDTVESLLQEYDVVAARTDALVLSVPDLDLSHELPPAPWFEPGARWSIRRVLMHIMTETAQHAGHADILRESIDGRKSMG